MEGVGVRKGPKKYDLWQPQVSGREKHSSRAGVANTNLMAGQKLILAVPKSQNVMVLPIENDAFIKKRS